jgi:hypothetical protein
VKNSPSINFSQPKKFWSKIKLEEKRFGQKESWTKYLDLQIRKPYINPYSYLEA